MAHERCNVCDQPAAHVVEAVVPTEVAETAAGKGKTPVQLYPWVSFDRVRFLAHNAACGLPCGEGMTDGEKAAANGQYHSPEACPYCYVAPSEPDPGP